MTIRYAKGHNTTYRKDLRILEQFSQSGCLFECALESIWRRKAEESIGHGKACWPWYYPLVDPDNQGTSGGMHMNYCP